MNGTTVFLNLNTLATIVSRQKVLLKNNRSIQDGKVVKYTDLIQRDLELN